MQYVALFPEDNILSQEIESWRGFAECLPPIDKKEFPSEPVIMALVFEQHKLIRWLKSKFDVEKSYMRHTINQSQQ
jgi:hypothetical protein